MTLLNVYRKNADERPANNGIYRFSDVLRDFFGEDLNPHYYGFSSPRVNVIEEKEHFNIYMALPGLKKSDLKIDLEGDVLKVWKKKEETEMSFNFTRKEFDYSEFERSFNLPEDIDREKIKASMENGILNITLPKKEEAIEKGPREIKIS
jgi:HSP20 family protein